MVVKNIHKCQDKNEQKLLYWNSRFYAFDQRVGRFLPNQKIVPPLIVGDW